MGCIVNLEQVGLYRDDNIIFISDSNSLIYRRKSLRLLNCYVYKFKWPQN